MDVHFIDLAGHHILHVLQVALQMLDVEALPSLASLDYRTFFSLYIDLTVRHPLPYDTFVVTVDGFLKATEHATRLSY